MLVWDGKALIPPSLSLSPFFVSFLNKSNDAREKTPCRKTDNKMALSLKYRRKMRREISRRELAATIRAVIPRPSFPPPATLCTVISVFNY